MPHAPRDTRSRILAVLLSALFMSLLSVSIVNVALPSIQTSLNASNSAIQWALSGYSLALGVIMVAAGRAGDILGRGRIFLAGVVVFGLASAVSALAPDATVLDVGRFFMGFGAGLFTPQVGGLIQEHFRGFERARAFGAFGAVVGVAVGIGPTFGGFLIGALPGELGWRMTVGVNVPVAGAVVVLGCMWIPRDDGDRNREHLLRRLDPVGAALLGVAIVGVMLPFMLASQKPWAWWFLPGGLATLAVWWGWELALSHRGRGEAMVDPSLFRIPSFTLGSAMITVFFAGMTSVMVIEALFIQRGLGRSALVSGLVVLPAALAQVYSAPLAGRLVRTWGRKVVVWGLWINVLGLALIGAVALLLTDGGSVWWLVPASLPLGFGNGWVASPNQALTLREVPVSTGGTASGIMQTGQRIATAVGSAAVTGIFFHNVSDGYPRALVLSFTVICGFMVAALALSYVDERLARGTSLFDDVGDGGLDGKD